MQDLYRCILAASWSCQPAELPADECIEDIFAGGNGWRTAGAASAPGSGDDGDANHGTLRPGDLRRMAQHQQSRRSKPGRAPSAAASDRSGSTVMGHRRRPKAVRIAHDDDGAAGRDDVASVRSGSLGSLAPTLGSSSSSDGDGRPGRDSAARRPREVDEFHLRDDLVAWKLPSVAA